MTGRPEPVVVAAAIAGVIEAGLIMAIALGWIDFDDDQLNSVVEFVTLFLALIIPVLLALWPRTVVTPLIDPRDSEGRRLVPLSEDVPE